MSDEPIWRRYLRFRGRDIDADVDEELRFHLEMHEQSCGTPGATPKVRAPRRRPPSETSATSATGSAGTTGSGSAGVSATTISVTSFSSSGTPAGAWPATRRHPLRLSRRWQSGSRPPR